MNHIDPGVYILQQRTEGYLLEVGRLFVLDGTPVKQHWFLYGGVPTPRPGEPQRYAIYKTPSGTPVTGRATPLKITSALGSDVELWFSHVTAAPATFDGASYKADLERTGLQVTYIEGTCVDRGNFVPTPILVDWNGQIDWAAYVIMQKVSDKEQIVGYAQVDAVRDGAGDAIDPDKQSVENWLLYTKFPATDLDVGFYEAPGRLNGAYRTTFTTVGLPRSPEYSFQHIQVTCLIK